MASAMRGSRTPSPPPSGIRTPPAPRLGFHDDWQPYAPRKSARLANRTPSPRAPRRQTGSPQPTKNISSAAKSAWSSSMVSPMPSPRKRRQPPTSDAARRVSGPLTAEGTTNAAASLGIDHSTPRKSSSTTFSHELSMLPTPSKTPSKPPAKESVKGLQTFARNLFQSEEDVMPNNKKRMPRKYSGMTLDSFTAEAAEDESIEIFTDSKDRVPERDDSAENPFYGESVTEPAKRRSKRRNVSIPGEKAQTVEEATERQDGMVYVFRGKRFFRKFAPEMDSSEASADGMSSSLSRSSIKPRLLFPVQKVPRTSEDDVDEEATTDIEEGPEVDVGEQSVLQTPAKTQFKGTDTPQAPKFAPMSPPDTKRTTRSTNKLFEEPTPIKKKERRSPFDTWPRTKDRKETGTKREAEPMFAPAKRTKA